MKRLVFCFDGTWNRLDAPYPTNVVVAAESVLPLAGGTAQLIFYDEGVGTDKHERFRGGIFGGGLVKNLADAYRFLIFNYTPGDQIYIYGFSRGAYTARSFAGLLHTCGVLVRKEAARVGEAIELYKQRGTSEEFKQTALAFRRDYSPEVCLSDEEEAWRYKSGNQPKSAARIQRLSIAYLGIWDTVGALGIPGRYKLLSWINKKHSFHDTDLSAFVESARHAVAIDERRKDFQPTLWENLGELNTQRKADPTAPDAPYQQVWFPGVHGAVGGGGERRGLSDQALDWVLDGARSAGLVLDSGTHSRIFELKPDYTEYLDNQEKPGPVYRLMNWLGAAGREPGPKQLHEVSRSARRRWLEDSAHLRGGGKYRPQTLSAAAAQLDALNPADYGLGEAGLSLKEEFELYEVKRNDTLSAIAKQRYGDPKQYPRIYRANLDKLDSPDRIYQGQLLRIPK
jgi:uncharacterized protein (DUF2235 family)